MTTPSRLTNGLSTVAKPHPLDLYPLPAPFDTASTNGMGVATYANDFLTVPPTTEWTVTGAGSAIALTSAVGGEVTLTPGGATVPSSFYKGTASFQFIAGQHLWYETRMQISALTPASTFGLQYGSATTDGLWFSQAATTGIVSLISTVATTATTLVAAVATLTAATFMDLALHYDGLDLNVWAGTTKANMAKIARIAAPTIGATGASTLTNKLLTPFFQITPTATETLSADFVLTAQEVAR